MPPCRLTRNVSNRMMKLTKSGFAKARDFILVNARMIERRLFEYHFCGGAVDGVFHAVYAYRNQDGGFGHGMEPDTASPESQPLFSIMAMETLDEVGCLTADMLLSDFMPYFESVTTEKGGIPWMFKPKGEYPRAEHFENVKEWAALSTTAPLLGMLEKHGLEIPWMQKAEEYVWSEIERIGKRHIFCSLCISRRMLFLEHTRSRDRAHKAIEHLKGWILEKGVLCEDKSQENWGLYGSPNSLNYAPDPNCVLRSLFTCDLIEEDLNETIRRQQEDGRWDTYYGSSEGMKLEWAGIQTLSILKMLKAYGHIE